MLNNIGYSKVNARVNVLICAVIIVYDDGIEKMAVGNHGIL